MEYQASKEKEVYNIKKKNFYIRFSLGIQKKESKIELCFPLLKLHKEKQTVKTKTINKLQK